MEIDYLALFVVDVERSLIFYRDVLGFQFDKPAKNGGIEGCSGGLKIGIYARDWLPKLLGDRGKQPISGQPFLLSMTVADLDATYQHLLTCHVDIITPPTVMAWGQRLLFLSDPDGNLLEVVEGK